jgi:hypothetical protein
MSEETKPPTTTDAVTEQDKGRCAPALGSELTLGQAKRFEWLWHGTTEAARSKIPENLRKQVEAVLGHELSIS